MPQTFRVSSVDLGRAKPKSAIRMRGYAPGVYRRRFSGYERYSEYFFAVRRTVAYTFKSVGSFQ